MFVKEHPILFSNEMVCAILDGNKTQTRRVVKHKHCPYGRQGEKLWVREAFKYVPPGDGDNDIALVYRARTTDFWPTIRWKPGIHMRRADSRITLEITDVRQEWLQNISEKDAKAEGVWYGKAAHELYEPSEGGLQTHRECFRELWDLINGKSCAWVSNPRVWVIEFERI